MLYHLGQTGPCFLFLNCLIQLSIRYKPHMPRGFSSGASNPQQTEWTFGPEWTQLKEFGPGVQSKQTTPMSHVCVAFGNHTDE